MTGPQTARPANHQAMLDAMRELVVLRGADGRIITVNAAFLDAFGGELTDWTGRTFMPGPDPDAANILTRFDASMSTRHGQVRIDWSVTPCGGGVLAVGRDVTEERRAHAEETEAARGKNMFFAAVTHELRTPLSGALGAAALLEDTGLRPDQGAYLDALRSSAGHALKLIDDILDLSRLEAGRLELRMEPVDVRALIEDVCEILAPHAAERALVLAHAINADTPARVRADPARLRQILYNLAGNALKFTREGGVLVSAGYRGGLLTLSVRDSGPGVARSEQARLFEFFERGAAAHSGEPGAGLGLAMVRRLAEAMGGEAGVASEPGDGALFWCSLKAEALVPPPCERPLGGLTVLAASPSEFLRASLTRQAESLGAHAFEAAEPGAAARLAHAVEGRLTVILDERWAGEAGAVKAAAPDARILALAEPRTKDLFSASTRPHGFDGWLVAPVRLSSLAAHAGGLREEENGPAPAARRARVLEGLRVLVAEDDPVNAMIARTVLARLGAQAELVTNGKDAVEAAASGAFDAALIDMRMPVMDGLEAAVSIRALATPAAHTPLIALTANATEADRAACLGAGMDDFLAKPLDPDALGRAITALCPPPKRASIG